MAEQLAAKLNNKLNYQPKEEDDVNLLAAGAENVFKKYEEELEINDFPQQARWKVTSKVQFNFTFFFIIVFFFSMKRKIINPIITGSFGSNIGVFRSWFNCARYICTDRQTSARR